MKTNKAVTERLSILDEVYKNRGRQNFVGTLVVGTGLTITALGIIVLTNKPNIASETNENITKQLA